MKKFIAIVLCAVMALSFSATALAAEVVLSPQTVYVDGAKTSFEVYNIDGNNYFKLRDIAYVMNGTPSQFAVGWDDATRTVSITTKGAYEKNGSELDVTGGNKASTAVPSAQTIMIDGKVRSDLSVYNIGGNNFFKLRDMGTALGFYVDYDAAKNSVIIESFPSELIVCSADLGAVTLVSSGAVMAAVKPAGVSYANGVLTLDGASLTGDDFCIYAEGNLHIALSGTSVLTGGSSGIAMFSGSLTFEGDGAAYVNTTTVADCIGIIGGPGKDVRFNGGTVYLYSAYVGIFCPKHATTGAIGTVSVNGGNLIIGSTSICILLEEEVPGHILFNGGSTALTSGVATTNAAPTVGKGMSQNDEDSTEYVAQSFAKAPAATVGKKLPICSCDTMTGYTVAGATQGSGSWSTTSAGFTAEFAATDFSDAMTAKSVSFLMNVNSDFSLAGAKVKFTISSSLLRPFVPDPAVTECYWDVSLSDYAKSTGNGWYLVTLPVDDMTYNGTSMMTALTDGLAISFPGVSGRILVDDIAFNLG